MSKQYNEMKLSEDKKRDMIAAIKQGNIKTKKSYVGIVVPLFITVAAFLFAVTNQGVISNSTVNGAGLNFSEWTTKSNFIELLILWTVSLFLLMMAYVQFFLLISNPERLKEYRIFRKANEVYGTWRMIFIGAVPFVWIAIETIVLLFLPHNFVAQFFIVLLLFLNVVLIQLRFVKGRTRATCPHCGIELKNKEILLNKKCGVCGNGKMRKVQNSIQEFFATFSGMIVMFFPFFQLSLIFVLIYAIFYLLFTCYFILPYLYVYTKETDIPPPLW